MIFRNFSTITYVHAIIVHAYILSVFILSKIYLTYVILTDEAIPTGLVFRNGNNFSSDDKSVPRLQRVLHNLLLPFGTLHDSMELSPTYNALHQSQLISEKALCSIYLSRNGQPSNMIILSPTTIHINNNKPNMHSNLLHAPFCNKFLISGTYATMNYIQTT